MLDRPPRKGRDSLAPPHGVANSTHPNLEAMKTARQAQAERTRRYRRRQANGRMIVAVEIDAATIDMLCKLHWLAEADASDRRKIEAALSAMIADAARTVTRRN
jgi:hypothetical protein